MHSMTNESMRQANGGKIYTYYKCSRCFWCFATEWAVKLHIKVSHNGLGNYKKTHITY